METEGGGHGINKGGFNSQGAKLHLKTRRLSTEATYTPPRIKLFYCEENGGSSVESSDLMILVLLFTTSSGRPDESHSSPLKRSSCVCSSRALATTQRGVQGNLVKPDVTRR